MLYIHNKTVTEKIYLTKLPCQNKLIFKYMICNSSVCPVTFGTMIKCPPENNLVIGSNLLWHERFFINHTEMHMKCFF